jgi:hypothetical protein
MPVTGADSTPSGLEFSSERYAPGDTALAREKQRKTVAELRYEPRKGMVDSMHLNEKIVLALHAVPAAERRTAAEVARLVKDCDQLTTAVPPGDWDVFVIAAGFDLIDGVSLSFTCPDDWTIGGFTLNPELSAPIVMGDLRAEQPRPYLIAFGCVAHPDRVGKVPEDVQRTTGETLVIGRLELTAPSPGSLVLSDHSNPAYGPPEVANCWAVAADVPPGRRGRIDIGHGPGARPCAAKGGLSPHPVAEGAKKGGEVRPPR